MKASIRVWHSSTAVRDIYNTAALLDEEESKGREAVRFADPRGAVKVEPAVNMDRPIYWNVR